jgi:DNA polymerase III delta prime subunit
MNNDDNNQTTAVAEPPPAATEPNPFAERAAQEAKQPKKASLLDSITTRKRRRPPLILLYGPPGVGKSTFGSTLPKPIFIQAERGLDQITCDRFPLLRTLADYKRQILTLAEEPHEYESIVIDTVDGLDLLIQADVCRTGKVNSIEDFGYGRGWTFVRETWVKVLDRLTEMSERWNILLIAHAGVKVITDPQLGTPYDQWQLRLQDRSADILKQSVDLLLFAQLARTIDKETPRSRKGRAIVSEDRELWTSPVTGVLAKNRFGLENPMEFSWQALEQAINKFYER